MHEILVQKFFHLPFRTSNEGYLVTLEESNLQPDGWPEEIVV
jgi:hypothetical protein